MMMMMKKMMKMMKMMMKMILMMNSVIEILLTRFVDHDRLPHSTTYEHCQSLSSHGERDSASH